jgi:CheY-like chemotaxis protein
MNTGRKGSQRERQTTQQGRPLIASYGSQPLLAKTSLICGNCAGSAYGKSGFCQVTLRRLPLLFSTTALSIQLFRYSPYCTDTPVVREYGRPSTGSPLSAKDFVGTKLPAKILIVDDQLAARTTIRSLLHWHGFQVCGEATNGKEAIEQVIELKPDIILLDINMPVRNGVSAALEIRQIAPQAKILFFTIHEGPALIASLRPYAHGFVSKSAAGTELIPTLNGLAGIAPAGSTKAGGATTD